MRALFLLPLVLLAACEDQDGGQPRMSTNIVDEEASFDVSNRAVTEDETVVRAEEGRPSEATPNSADPPPEQKPAVTPAGTLPASLHGRWTGLNDRCGDKSAELELTVTPKSLIFHESVGSVTGVAAGSGGKVRVDAAFTGEGDSWTKKLELRPSANGRELTIINDGAAVTRKRC